MTHTNEINLASAEEQLREAVRFGDAKDAKDAYSLLFGKVHTEIDVFAAKRLGTQDVVTTAEVLDRASARIYNQLVDFSEVFANDPEEIFASVPRIVIRFMNGDISFKKLLVSIIGNSKRGIVGELLRQDLRQRSIAHKYMKGGAPNPLNNAAFARFSRSEAQDVIDTKARTTALNKALEHLAPKERLALALKYDVGAAAMITSESNSQELRATLLRSLAIQFGFSKLEAELLSLRFKARIETESAFGSESKVSAAESDGMKQKDIAALFGMDASGASRLFARAKQRMHILLKNDPVFAA